MNIKTVQTEETVGQIRNKEAGLKLLLEFIKEDRPINAKELISRTGLSEYRVQYALMWLKGHDLIRRKRGGYVHIKKRSFD